MYLKLFILSIILVGLILLILGIKLIFNPKAEFTFHSCGYDYDNSGDDVSCFKCDIDNSEKCVDK